jgi:hypothetical protein
MNKFVYYLEDENQDPEARNEFYLDCKFKPYQQKIWYQAVSDSSSVENTGSSNDTEVE